MRTLLRLRWVGFEPTTSSLWDSRASRLLYPAIIIMVFTTFPCCRSYIFYLYWLLDGGKPTSFYKINFLTLYKYYNKFFIKNQLRFFILITFQHICAGKLSTSLFLFLGPRISNGKLHHLKLISKIHLMRFELMIYRLKADCHTAWLQVVKFVAFIFKFLFSLHNFTSFLYLIYILYYIFYKKSIKIFNWRSGSWTHLRQLNRLLPIR